jgi:hypothetical protein
MEEQPKAQNFAARTLSNVQAAGLYKIAVVALAILACAIGIIGSVLPIFGGNVPEQAWQLAQGAMIGLVGLIGANKAAA